MPSLRRAQHDVQQPKHEDPCQERSEFVVFRDWEYAAKRVKQHESGERSRQKVYHHGVRTPNQTQGIAACHPCEQDPAPRLDEARTIVLLQLDDDVLLEADAAHRAGRQTSDGASYLTSPAACGLA